VNPDFSEHILNQFKKKNRTVKNLSKGQVLVSEPFLSDPSFNRSVILITDHGSHGTIGYVLNHQTDLVVSQLIEGLDVVPQCAYQGGPVELDSLHYLHTYPEISDSNEVLPGVYWSGSFDEVCQGLMEGRFQAENFKFLVGYSGWAPEQLLAEMDEKAWLISELSPEVIFDTSIADKDLWKHAIRSVGGKDALLANSPEDPFLN
jgi:putative transcriptional regulator